MDKIGKVIILGGTHGDEMSGVFLASKWIKDDKDLKSRLTTCPVQVHISNPEAVKVCRRYVDCDLNRQFNDEIYAKAKSGEAVAYEIKRANELHEMVESSPAHEKPRLVLDLHNTTSNMGCTLIVSTSANVFSTHLAAYVQMNLRNEGFISEILTLGEGTYSCTRNLTEFGVGIEVGPQPQGVLRADILKSQERAVFYSLEFVDNFNKGRKIPASVVKTFKISRRIGFPLPCSEIMIHENVQDKDFQALSLSDPVFRTANDEILCLKDVMKTKDSGETFYPAFVNEAAYYEKDLAFWLTVVQNVELPALQSK